MTENNEINQIESQEITEINSLEEQETHKILTEYNNDNYDNSSLDSSIEDEEEYSSETDSEDEDLEELEEEKIPEDQKLNQSIYNFIFSNKFEIAQYYTSEIQLKKLIQILYKGIQYANWKISFMKELRNEEFEEYLKNITNNKEIIEIEQKRSLETQKKLLEVNAKLLDLETKNKTLKEDCKTLLKENIEATEQLGKIQQLNCNISELETRIVELQKENTQLKQMKELGWTKGKFSAVLDIEIRNGEIILQTTKSVDEMLLHKDKEIQTLASKTNEARSEVDQLKIENTNYIMKNQEMEKHLNDIKLEKLEKEQKIKDQQEQLKSLEEENKEIEKEIDNIRKEKEEIQQQLYELKQFNEIKEINLLQQSRYNRPKRESFEKKQLKESKIQKELDGLMAELQDYTDGNLMIPILKNYDRKKRTSLRKSRHLKEDFNTLNSSNRNESFNSEKRKLVDMFTTNSSNEIPFDTTKKHYRKISFGNGIQIEKSINPLTRTTHPSFIINQSEMITEKKQNEQINQNQEKSSEKKKSSETTEIQTRVKAVKESRMLKKEEKSGFLSWLWQTPTQTNLNQSFSTDYEENTVRREIQSSDNYIISSIESSPERLWYIQTPKSKAINQNQLLVRYNIKKHKMEPIKEGHFYQSTIFKCENYWIVKNLDNKEMYLFDFISKEMITIQFDNFEQFIPSRDKIYILDTKYYLHYFDIELGSMKCLTCIEENRIGDHLMIYKSKYLYSIINNKLSRYSLNKDEICEHVHNYFIDFFTILNDTIFFISKEEKSLHRCDLDLQILDDDRDIYSQKLLQLKTIGNVILLYFQNVIELFDDLGNKLYSIDIDSSYEFTWFTIYPHNDSDKFKLMILNTESKVYVIDTKKYLHNYVKNGHGICDLCKKQSYEIKCDCCGKTYHYGCIFNSTYQFDMCICRIKK